MIYVEAGFLSCIVILGFFCSLSDFRENIIPNKRLLAALLVSLPLHIALLILGAAPFYKTWLINMLLADLISFLLYYRQIWAAGDAKLFMTFYFLLPPTLLDADSLTYAIVPYMFIFVPALIWTFTDTLIRLSRKEARKNKSFQIKPFILSYGIIMIETTALYSLAAMLFPDFLYQNELFCAVLLVIYAYACNTSQLMKKWVAVLIHAIIIVLTLILNQRTLALPSWTSLLSIIIVIFAQRFASLYNYQEIDSSSVKKGMIPSAEAVMLFQASRVRSLPTDPSEELSARMSEEEALAVRRWATSKSGRPRIWIVRKVPFAFMISLGFLVWNIIRIAR